MIEHVADELDAVVGEASIRLRNVPEILAKTKLRQERWSDQEILGHPVDSAANSHQRFIRAQQNDRGEFAFPGYEQDEWVRLQAYQERPWQEVIELWASYNRHLAHAIRRIREGATSVICRIGAKEPVTLRFLVEDYPLHLRHHLQQIKGILDRGEA